MSQIPTLQRPHRAVARGPRIAQLIRDADALLIDFNGTLSDDEELIGQLVSEIAIERLGVRLDRERYFDRFLGRTEESLFQELSGDADPRRVGELVELFNRRYLDAVYRERRISGEAEAFVRAVHAGGTPIAVVTAASKTVAVPALSQIELLDQIDVVVALEDVERAKPDPACYVQALEVLGVEPERAVAFEDSPIGFAAARGAGLPVVGVGRGAMLSEIATTAVDALRPDLLIS